MYQNNITSPQIKDKSYLQRYNGLLLYVAKIRNYINVSIKNKYINLMNKKSYINAYNIFYRARTARTTERVATDRTTSQ